MKLKNTSLQEARVETPQKDTRQMKSIMRGLNKDIKKTNLNKSELSPQYYEEQVPNALNQEALEKLVADYGKNILNKTLDNQSTNILAKWVRAFGSIDTGKNPIFSLLNQLKQKGVNYKGSDILSINNAYADNVIHDEDLYNPNEVLLSNEFYGQSTDNQEFLLDIYKFFSDDSNTKRIKDALSSTISAKESMNEELLDEKKYNNYGKKTKRSYQKTKKTDPSVYSTTDDSELTYSEKPDMVILFGQEIPENEFKAKTSDEIRNLMLFDDSGKLRNPQDIEKQLNVISTLEKQKGTKINKDTTRQQKNQQVNKVRETEERVEKLRKELGYDDFQDLKNYIKMMG